ncbi:AlbA family DNA-binding domain-containing protein [Rhizobium leguminosarum]
MCDHNCLAQPASLNVVIEMTVKNKKPPAERGAKDTFARFLEEPSRESFRRLLTDNLGEGRYVDFKREWLPTHELAKKVLGFANRGPSCLVFGVAENDDKTLEPVGLDQFQDKADIQNKLRKLLPSSLMDQITTWDFSYESAEYEKIKGKKFQTLIIDYRPEYVPYTAIKGTTDLKDTAIYYRRDGLTIEASYDELQKIINDRIETGHSTRQEMDIKKHLEHLKALYDELPKRSPFFSHLTAERILGVQAADHLGQSYSEFVETMISLKKGLIAEELGLDRKSLIQGIRSGIGSKTRS